MHLHGNGTPVGDLRSGDHGCLTYTSQREQLRVLAPFVADGLVQNERILYVGGPEHRALARTAFGPAGAAALASGQMILERSERTYLRGGRFDPERMMYHYQSAERRALAHGYSGLRVAAEMTWAQSQQAGRLVRYEDELNEALAGRAATVLCLYDQNRFGRGMLADLEMAHPVAVNPNPVFKTRALQIYRSYDPHGIALAGEIDISNRDAFTGALDSLLGAPENDIEVDLTRVSFMDVTSIVALALAARNLGGGKRIRVMARRHLRHLFEVTLPHIPAELDVEEPG